MAREKHSQVGVVVGGISKHFPSFTHGSKYPNQENKHAGARAEVDKFERALVKIQHSRKYTDEGKQEKIDELVAEFDTQYQKWIRNEGMNERREALKTQLRGLCGIGQQRDPGDASGQASDEEDRRYFLSLSGDDKVDLIGAMTRGEEPAITAAVLRKGDRQMGLRTGLREELEAVNVRPENLKEASTLREELEAGEQADRAWEVAKGEILGRVEGSRAALDIQGRDALEAEGLQRVAGEKKVEPFVEPTVEPFKTDDAGMIDLMVRKKEDAA